MTWAAVNARQLADADLDAEDLAEEVVKRFDAWRVEIADSEMRTRRARDTAITQRARAAAIDRLREKIWNRNLVIGVMSMLVASMFLI